MTPAAPLPTMHGVMSVKYFFRDVAKRIAWTAKHPVFELRLAWYRFNPFPWIVAAIVGGMAVAISFAIDAMGDLRAERQEVLCLAKNVYYEARGESATGQIAVAEVTMNRLASGRYADSVCGVVYQKNWDPIRKRYVGAFSWTELDELPPLAGDEWLRALTIADAVYRGNEPSVLDDRTMFYHATYIKPDWAHGKRQTARIGGHVFYR
ncbi:MAG TPA: cell wall hydrolase [Burkholderiales bacterium]